MAERAQQRQVEWEPVLEPELPICDAHHHLWQRPTHRYLLEELQADLDSGHRIVSTIHVDCVSMYRASGPEALRPVGETEFVEAVAQSEAVQRDGRAICAANVGFADLNLGAAVGAVLDAHLAASPRFRGIRHCSAWDRSEQIQNAHTQPFENMLEDARFRQGFAELRKRDLSFDAWLFHQQIPELTALARAFPDTVIVLDHLGTPLGIGPYAGRRDEVFAEWKRSIATLARCPNVVIKLGGIQMPLNGFGFHKQTQSPTSAQLVAATGHYYQHAIEHFGVERCMFESNYPADSPSAPYRTLWNAFKRLTASFSAAEKAALYHDNAARIYRLRGPSI